MVYQMDTIPEKKKMKKSQKKSKNKTSTKRKNIKKKNTFNQNKNPTYSTSTIFRCVMFAVARHVSNVFPKFRD